MSNTNAVQLLENVVVLNAGLVDSGTSYRFIAMGRKGVTLSSAYLPTSALLDQMSEEDRASQYFLVSGTYSTVVSNTEEGELRAYQLHPITLEAITINEFEKYGIVVEKVSIDDLKPNSRSKINADGEVISNATPTQTSLLRRNQLTGDGQLTPEGAAEILVKKEAMRGRKVESL